MPSCTRAAEQRGWRWPRQPLAGPGIRITFSDEGPGIPDVGLALTDGWTTGDGLGLGLSGARRLVDEFELMSKPGGTSVVVAKWSR